MVYAVAVFVGLLSAGVLAMTRAFIVWPLQPFKGPIQPLSEQERARALRLEAHVRGVASRPHNLQYPEALDEAARYIEGSLRDLGASPLSQGYEVGGRNVRNIELVFEPSAHTRGPGTVVIGAHYDSADDSPGAHDNGTGVAALLEIARELHVGRACVGCRVRLVFFVNEEQPFGKTDDMGSLRHARLLQARGERVAGMIALETLGYFSQTPGSQRLPAPFKWLYPDRGNFVAFVGLPGSRTFLAEALRAFRAAHLFPSTGTISPASIEGADLSDHWAYHQTGVPALMITDTALYRNPFYHQPWDTPDTVDYQSLARIVSALCIMLQCLARIERRS
ncbi:MAG TPA: M28 family peptidase [Hyphomicrobium sp.]|nr:M28 family peptidase [Hyphomicrobium sp.]